MTPKQELLKHWTDAIDDNAEQKLHASALLDQAIDENSPSIPLALSQLQRVTATKRKCRHWGTILYTLIALICFMAQWRYGFVTQKSIIKSGGISGMLPSGPSALKTQTPEETLLIYGDPRRGDEAEQIRALWESDPKNPVYFAEYVRQYASIHHALPADCFEVAESIDPENGFYLMLHAALGAKPLVTNTKKDHPRSPVTTAHFQSATPDERVKLKRKIIKEYRLHDPEKAKNLLDSWRKSLQKPHYQNHSIAIHQQRAPILNRRTTWFDQFQPIAYIVGQKTLTIHERYLADLLVATLQAADFTTAEGQQLFRDVNVYAERIARMEFATIIDGLVARAILTHLYSQIHIIDTTTLDPIVVDVWKKRYDALLHLSDELQARESSNADIAWKHGSLMTGMILLSGERQTLQPPTITIGDLAPMRYADHCMIGKAMASSLCFLLLFLIPYHLLVLRKDFIHRVSYQVWQAVPMRKVIGLVICAVLLPMLAYLWLIIATPLTGKEWNMMYRGIFPAAPAVSVFLMILVLPRLLVKMTMHPWPRLSPSASVWYQRCGWVAFSLLLGPLLGMTWLLEAMANEQILFIVLGACCLPSIAWLIVGGLKAIFTKNFYERAMAGVRRRIIGVCTLSTLIILSIAVPVLQRVEEHSIQRDHLLVIDPGIPGIFQEAQVTRSIQKDLREVLGIEGE